MRVITPKHIQEKYDKISPYMEYREGEGVVLKEDAPEEIVKIRKELNEWNDKVRKQ